MVGVDPRFPNLLKNLRHDRGLSLRDLARQVHYSHSYLWDIETGRKQPTPEIAAALDTALAAGRALVELVTDDLDIEHVDRPPLLAAMDLVNSSRAELESFAGRAWSAAGNPGMRETASQWAQLAGWLYDAFVRRRPPLMRLGAQRYSRRLREETGDSPFRMEVLRQGRTPRAECRSVAREPAPAVIAERLMIEAGDIVVRRENRYFADGVPVQTGVTYIPAAVAGDSPAVRAKALGHGSLYARLEDLGHPVARIRESVIARLPTPDEATSLAIPPGVPVLDVLHTSYDDHARPFEVTRFTIRADVAVINYEMPVED